MINDLVLIPVFLVFLGITLWGLSNSRKKYGRTGPFALGVAGAITAFAALWFFVPLAYAGLAAVFAASVWDIVLSYQYRRACGT